MSFWSCPLKAQGFHSIYIRTVSSLCLLSTLLNQFKLVYGPLGRSTCTVLYSNQFCPGQSGKNWMCQSQGLTVLIYILCLQAIKKLISNEKTTKKKHFNLYLFYLLDRKTKSSESNERDGIRLNWIFCLKAYNDTLETVSKLLPAESSCWWCHWSFGQTIAQPKIGLDAINRVDQHEINDLKIWRIFILLGLSKNADPLLHYSKQRRRTR